MSNSVGVELEVLYQWKNLKVISRFGVLNGMHSRASVQLAIKYRQARAPLVKLPMKAKLVFGLST